MSEYENYAFMLQHCIQAIQHAHSFSMQAFETREKLADMKKEVSALKKENKAVLIKMKKLEDQAEAATKAQQMAEEKAESAEAIKKVAEAEKRDAGVKKAQAEKELEEALATKNAEITEADEKAYAQGMVDVTEDYKLQVEAIRLPFPPPAPSSSQAEDESESEVEDEDNNEDEALVRKSKDATEAKSLPPTE
ncbi:methyl-CpG-binding domain-containing protein 10-like [Camellia sinensis]|uniref:methyl-CpG-binding domain-containing protein 10-like n=1 Tax=Camellia sinensis TaxID=4442 RepID=UPI00103617FF|nr:methyl-CpG-binding domain-containing protein 10-like [Camellia sinensis]